MISSDRIYSTTITSETMFVAEMSAEERIRAQQKRATDIFDFVQTHWDEI